MKKTYVMIGASAAGIACANQLSRLEPNSIIRCFTAENQLPYNKCFLVGFLAGKWPKNKVYLQKAPGVQLHLNTLVADVNADNQEIITQSGERFTYDALLLATGSRVNNRLLPGSDIEGVFSFYTLGDALAINTYIESKNVTRALIIGAGLTGLEVADALVNRGIAVTILERGEEILHAQGPSEVVGQIQAILIDNGVSLHCMQDVQSFEKMSDSQIRVRTASKYYDADMVIQATGWHPHTTLAQSIGLVMDGQHVAVNEYMQTSNLTIYAAGDIVCVMDALGNTVPSILWPDAMVQGIHAAYAMAGKEKKYNGLRGHVHSMIFGKKIMF